MPKHSFGKYDMELRELETFRAVVDAGGVARASQRLHRAQSSVTARIRQLEASLGVPLFRREGRRLRLTEAGDALLGYADRLLSLADEARVAVRRDGVRGRVRLGAMESVAASRLPRPLASFHRQYPEVAVELQTAPSRTLLARLQAGELDLAIVGDELADDRFEMHPLYPERLVMVAASGCPLLEDPARLGGQTLLVFHGQGCAYRRRFENWLQSLRVVPGRVLEYGSYHAILASAASGLGVSLVPQSVLDTYPQRDALSVRSVPGRIAQLRTIMIHPRQVHAHAVRRLASALTADASASAGTIA
jgi:DNA-binding transcriptional LysR family regulator